MFLSMAPEGLTADNSATRLRIKLSKRTIIANLKNNTTNHFNVQLPSAVVVLLKILI